MIKIVCLSPVPMELISGLLKAGNFAAVDELSLIAADAMSGDEIAVEVRDAQIIIGDFTFNRPITREIARSAAGSVKLIQQPSVGYQHFDIGACAEYGLSVANTAGANTIGVAEHTVLMGLLLMKKIMAAHAFTSAGEWRQMDIGAGEISGKTWGIIGMGRVGVAVAERLVPFKLNGLYFDLNGLGKELEEILKVTRCELEELIQQSDIISLHCPLTRETEKLINEDRIAMMKPGAVIINVARGEVVDETALAKALDENRIGGAALDVFSAEPIKKDNPLLFVRNGNLVLTPHIAGATNESKGRIINFAFQNIIRVLRGGEPQSLVTG